MKNFSTSSLLVGLVLGVVLGAGAMTLSNADNSDLQGNFGNLGGGNDYGDPGNNDTGTGGYTSPESSSYPHLENFNPGEIAGYGTCDIDNCDLMEKLDEILEKLEKEEETMEAVEETLEGLSIKL